MNACVQNKWVDGIPPAIYWFDDRVKVVSYGGIPKGLTKKEFLLKKTNPVNKELMNIFLQCRIVEQSGHGVPIIVREYGEKTYQFSENSITVSIPFDKSGFFESDTQNDLELIIIDLIRKDDKITKEEIAEIVHKPKATISRCIRKSNKIQYIGTSKSGYWMIND